MRLNDILTENRHLWLEAINLEIGWPEVSFAKSPWRLSVLAFA